MNWYKTAKVENLLKEAGMKEVFFVAALVILGMITLEQGMKKNDQINEQTIEQLKNLPAFQDYMKTYGKDIKQKYDYKNLDLDLPPMTNAPTSKLNTMQMGGYSDTKKN